MQHLKEQKKEEEKERRGEKKKASNIKHDGWLKEQRIEVESLKS